MSEYKAWTDSYQGEPAVWLRAGKYEAVMLPECGGNLVAFRDLEANYRFLHEPKESEMEAFKKESYSYGIPVLFPPNRYEDGKFPWKGKTHQLPVNESERGNHLHGFLHNVPWKVTEMGQTSSESFVTVQVQVDENHPVFQSFPFRFTFMLRYALSENGLSQQVTIRNNGTEEMPSLLAFHTAVNVPFAANSPAEGYRVKLTIGERWELNERMLPTKRFQPFGSLDTSLKNEGIYPFTEEMDNHYTVQPQNGRNRMELTDTTLGVTFVYDAGTAYKQWMIWNNFNRGEFFCPEPQVNLVNAPNVDLPAEEVGLYSIGPGEIWESVSRMYVK
ncbi:aldose 1-epimerase [Marinicrinis lubricantis]|uniref:Aldose 1-epimerase n=1 Tax=Marinicrinis lubricantis TaxID=2086470 RepID=A0ABW1IP65_9BACL